MEICLKKPGVQATRLPERDSAKIGAIKIQAEFSQSKLAFFKRLQASRLRSSQKKYEQ
jgi:hypothetical protein